VAAFGNGTIDRLLLKGVRDAGGLAELSTTARVAHWTRFSIPIFSSMARSRLWIYYLSRTAVKQPFVSNDPRDLYKSWSDARTIRRVYFQRRPNFAVHPGLALLVPAGDRGR